MANEWDVVSSAPASSADPWAVVSSVPATSSVTKKTPPSWFDVLRSAPVKAIAGAADIGLNAALQPARMSNQLAVLRDRMFGSATPTMSDLITGQRPQQRPNLPYLPVYTAFGTQTGAIAPTPNMTTGQKIADVGLQAATGSLFGPWNGLRTVGVNMLAAGAGAAGGEVVSEATGSPTAGLIASLAAIPAAGYGIKKTGAALGDIFSPEQRAARLTKAVVGPDIAAVRAAILMHPDKPVSEALMLESVNNPALQTLAQVTGTDARWTEALRRATTQQEIDDLARLAGGETQTAAITSQRAGKAELNEQNRQKRDIPLYQAGLYNTRGREAEQKLAEASAEASAAANDARRFGRVSGDPYADVRTQPRVETPAILGTPPPEPLGVQQRVDQWMKDWVKQGFGPATTREARNRVNMASKAEEVATQRAGQSLEAGEARWESQQTLASMKAAGLQPLRPDTILAHLRSASSDPAIAGNKQIQQVYKHVEAMLNDWVNQHGDISPEALYSIRKWGVSSIVDDLLGSQSQQAKKKFAAGVIAKLNPVIDDAIEAAGGKGWKDYLKAHAAGMHKLEQQEFAAKALEMYKTNPKGFVELVKGNNPEAIEDVFGPGSYDIAKEMGTNMSVLQKVAGQVSRRDEASRLATLGADEFKKYAAETSSRFHLPNLLSRPAALANQVATLLQGRVDRKTLDLLAEGFKKGRSLEELLNVVPFKDRVTVMKTLQNSAIYQPGALAATTNALAEP